MGRGSSRGSSSCEFCSQFSVDEFLDGRDLDVVPRAERENEDRFVVECDATGKVAVQPRLYDAEVLVMHMYLNKKILSTYVNPDAPWCLTQLENLVLQCRT